MQIQENIPLAPLTTFKLGGSARYLVRVQDHKEVYTALSFAKERALRVLILGGGSNILVSDTGFDGLVIKIEFAGVELQDTTLIAGAGESWDGLVKQAVDDGLWGLENLSGIPGTVGGAVVQNIGAYGAALSQTLQWVEMLDTQTQKIIKLEASQCAFGYRTSTFKKNLGRYIILRAAFGLFPEAQPNMGYKDPTRAYKDLARIFGDSVPSLSDIRTAIISIRTDKFPDLSQEGTAGSFFLNPVVPPEQAQALKERYPDIPLFVMPETANIKVPLGWILDHVLNLRGFALGEVRLFEKQALVIAASRKAKASDVMLLAQKIKKEVQEKIHIEIEEEVRILD